MSSAFLRSTGTLVLSNPDVAHLTGLVDAFHRVTPLDQFRVWQPAVPGAFTYRFRAVDGRVWLQTIDFAASATDPSMTFEVQPGWKVSEFAQQREIRDLIVKLVGTRGLLEYRWEQIP